MARAAAGQGAVCLLTGEAGVGKTAVARAFAARARDEATVLWGTSWAAGAAPAYWPWRQVLRALLDDNSPDLTALGDAAGQVARLLPELGAEPSSEPEPERSRFALFDGIAALLTAAARRRPLVVVLDDLHDADEPSVALLGFLGRALAANPVVYVGTSRDVDTGLPGDLGARLGQEVTLPLRGLGLDDVADLVALHAPGAPESFVMALRERTEGNPFFIEELLALAGGVPDPGSVAELPVPRAVRDVIRARLAPLPPDSAELLGTASVIGIGFGLGALAAAAGIAAAEAIVLLNPPRGHGLEWTGPAAVSASPSPTLWCAIPSTRPSPCSGGWSFIARSARRSRAGWDIPMSRRSPSSPTTSDAPCHSRRPVRPATTPSRPRRAPWRFRRGRMPSGISPGRWSCTASFRWTRSAAASCCSGSAAPKRGPDTRRTHGSR